MLNRRYLRVKVLQGLYAFWQNAENDQRRSLHEIFKSIERMFELYLLLLQLLIEVRNVAGKRIEEAKRKKLPTREDLNPNMKFVNNRLITALESNEFFLASCADYKIAWTKDDAEIVNKAYAELIDSPVYKNYMRETKSDFISDRELCQDWFKKMILPMELMHNHFQAKDIYWYDDYYIVCFNVLKTLKSIRPGGKPGHNILLPLYKNHKEDKEFTEMLFLKAIEKREEHTALIAENTKNWEVDRIAMIDLILMNMAICELLDFETIPVKVTLNEYIEMSKDYSTPRSQVFINGVLDKLVESFNISEKIVKKGRGLKE